MTSRRASALLAIVICAGTPWHVGAQIDYYRPDALLAFAEYLYASGDYRRAAGEFERYVFAVGASPSDGSVRYRIAECYEAAGDYPRAREEYQEVLRLPVSPELVDRVRYRLAVIPVEMGAYGDARAYIRAHVDSVRSPEVRSRMMQLMVFAHLSEGQFEQANGYFGTPGNGYLEHGQDTLWAALRSTALRGTRLHRKNRWVGGALSAVLPGTGKMHAGRASEGLYSMALVGLTGWQAVAGWSRSGRRSVRGAIYGSICAGLYLGNIYGSVIAVDVWNRKREAEVLGGLSVTAFY